MQETGIDVQSQKSEIILNFRGLGMKRVSEWVAVTDFGWYHLKTPITCHDIHVDPNQIIRTYQNVLDQ